MRQSLQQFVSQSKWDPVPVRQAIAARISTVLRPAAWAVDEVTFVKHGSYSAAVERQYSRTLGRVGNCQLGLTASLVDQTAAVPVNWRLMIPPSWEADNVRRHRAHLPDDQRHQPCWQYALELVDELCEAWPVQPAPVVSTAYHTGEAEPLLAGLDDRRMPYLVEVHGDLRALPDLGATDKTGLPQLPRQTRPTALRELVRSGGERRQTATWRDPNGRIGRAQFVLVPVRSAGVAAGMSPVDAPYGPARRARRLLLAEWPLGRSEPRRYWLTNLFGRRLSELVELVRLGARPRESLDEMSRYGLFDFEGRSFVGWHHHVTLSTAAYAFDVLQQRASEAATAPGAVAAPPRPYWE
jgi:hypothetical protein